MFAIEKYFASPYEDDILEIEIGDERFKVRRLDGLDAVRLYDLRELDARFVHILAACLLDDKTNEPIGREYAIRFIRQYRTVAIDVAVEIIDLSCRIAELEERIADDAKKNC